MSVWCVVGEADAEYYCPWYLFVLPSVAIYLGVLLLLLAAKAFACFSKKWGCRTRLKRHHFVVSRLHDFAFGYSTAGRLLLLAVFLMSLASFVFYLMDAAYEPSLHRVVPARARSSSSLNSSLNSSMNASTSLPATNFTGKLNVPHSSFSRKHSPKMPLIVLRIDAAFNIAFALHFFVRLIAASDKLLFWLTWPTLVDVATVPTCAMFIIYKKFWPGLRFFRAFYLMSIPDLLQLSGLLKDIRGIRLLRILTSFLTLWFVAAGFIHMFENNGDPWLHEYNGQQLSYFECIYFLIITSSTIGYGDISCKTTLGRVFDVGFVFVGLAMFANILPEMATIVQLTSPYIGSLRLPIGRKHVIVIGHIKADSAIKFVEAFLHPDRAAENICVVFLNAETPSLGLEALLKSRNNVYYFMGDEMDVKDLKRVDLENAEACIILADQLAHNPDEEDSANIMRAISIKNCHGSTRILIQLIRERNKSHLLHIPNWNALDGVVCLDEFKMGAIAQNCWAPGFATLLSLLITAYSGETDSSSTNDLGNLKNVYLQGVGLEIYGTELSQYFEEMTFTDAVEFCYRRLQLVLVAIKSSDKSISGDHAAAEKLSLNPGSEYIIRSGDHGFFVAHSADAADRATFYCKKCHSDETPLAMILPCSCEERQDNGDCEEHLVKHTKAQIEAGKASWRVLQLLRDVKHSQKEGDALVDNLDHQVADKSSPLLADKASKSSNESSVRRRLCHDEVDEKFDFTGMFYWRQKRPINDVVITMREAVERDFTNHVVVCVFAEPDSPQIGLRNFVMPLRSSNRLPNELKPIVMIGNLGFFQREWEQIDTFPLIYIIPGSAMDRTILRSVNVNHCDMCVLVSAKLPIGNQALIDKYAILGYLNIKSMKFGGENETDQPQAQLQSKATNGESAAPTHTSIGIRTPVRRNAAAMQQKQLANKAISAAPTIANNISVITEIAIPENILILDDDASHTTSTPLVQMWPFSCGNTFAGDVLNSAISVSYYNPDALTLIRELVTGGSTADSDQIFAEGLGFCEGTDVEKIRKNRNRAKLHEFSLTHSDYSQYATGTSTYAELFVGVLREFGYVCLGICRVRDQTVAIEERRVVLVSPPAKFLLQPSDKVICIQSVDLNSTD